MRDGPDCYRRVTWKPGGDSLGSRPDPTGESENPLSANPAKPARSPRPARGTDARQASGRPATTRGRRSRWLPRTGPRAVWPGRAHRAGQIAVLATVFLLVFGFLLVRLSPATFLRLVDIYRSLPATVVAIVLVSGVVYFALDSLRLVATDLFDPDGARRRPWLLATVGCWALLTVAAAVGMLWFPSWSLFGSL